MAALELSDGELRSLRDLANGRAVERHQLARLAELGMIETAARGYQPSELGRRHLKDSIWRPP
jgi:hypothetical protein